MLQRHPLQNPSLAPYGFVFPYYKTRLEFQPKEHPFWVNEEKIAGRVWDRCNRANAPKPLPVQTIIHEILPGQKSANRITAGDFWHDGLPYQARDILMLSTAVQWFGTNCGRCFLETDISGDSIPGFHPEREFLIKLAKEHFDLAAHLAHECSERCKVHRLFARYGCYFAEKDVTPRDRAVLDGLMRWLGRKPGRAFAVEFTKRKKNAWADAHKRMQAAFENSRKRYIIATLPPGVTPNMASA